MHDLIDEPAPPIRRRLTGQNVPDSERAVSAAAGAALALRGVRQRGILGGVLAGVGAALVARGITGRSAIYRNLSMQGGIEVRRSVIVQRTRRDVFAFVRALRNMPRFMTHVTSVEGTGKTSRWVAEVGPIKLVWYAEIVDDLPDLRLSWRTLPAGGDLIHEGAIDLEDAPGERGTLLTLSLRFQPPAGVLGASVKGLLRALTSNQLATDLIRLRQLIETGEVASGVRRIAELDDGERQSVGV